MMQGGTLISVLCLGCVALVLVGGLVFAAWRVGLHDFLRAFSLEWNPQRDSYGVLPMLVGSLLLASLATIMALPLCLGLMGFLWSEERSLLGKVVRNLLRFMVSIPTVVYGFCAVILLVPLMRDAFTGTGMHLTTTALVLSLLILPTMSTVVDNALALQLGNPQGLTLAGCALGLSRLQIFWLIALPAQKRWVGTGVLLAFGRALGDTMLPLMLSGNAPILPSGLFSSIRTLATHINLLTATEIRPQIELTLYLAGFLLLLTSVGVSLCARLMQRECPIKSVPDSRRSRWITCLTGCFSLSQNPQQRRMRNAFLRLGGRFAAIVFTFVVGGNIVFLLVKALPQLSLELVFGTTPPLAALFTSAPVWDGLWPAIAGTGALLLVSMSIALPLGIATGVYLAEYAGPSVRRSVVMLLEVFVGIPSIIMGLFGFLFILALRRSFAPSAGTCLVLAAFCLALLVLPVFILTLHAALRSIPHALRVTAAVMGLSRNVAVWRIFVPKAGKGIMSAFFLAAGRCAEDTAVILMTGVIANASRTPSLTGKFEALPFYIYYTTANYQNEIEFMRVFAAAFFLLALACMLFASGHFFHQLAFNEWSKQR